MDGMKYAFLPFRELPDGARQQARGAEIPPGVAALKVAVGEDGCARYSAGRFFDDLRGIP